MATRLSGAARRLAATVTHVALRISVDGRVMFLEHTSQPARKEIGEPQLVLGERTGYPKKCRHGSQELTVAADQGRRLKGAIATLLGVLEAVRAGCLRRDVPDDHALAPGRREHA